MKTFLMCEPTYFEVKYVINPWMKGNLGQVNKSLATRQWERLYNVIAQRASIKLVQPAEGLPDMVFTANAGLVLPNHEVILSSFLHPERQPEAAHFARFFEDMGYHVRPVANGVVFEGAGDALYGADGKLWFGHGPRSDLSAVTELAATQHAQPKVLSLIDPKWYHLDTAFCPLGDGHVIAYQQAFAQDSVREITAGCHRNVIWVSDQDANNFACNAVNIGDDIILHQASPALRTELESKGFSVIEVNVSEFIKAGGACKCMTLEI